MKKLLRKWLKRQIIKAHTMPKQSAFEWIYDSPITTWRDKLFCLRCAGCEAKKAYDWLIDKDRHNSLEYKIFA